MDFARPPLGDAIRLDLTRNTALPSGLLILEYAVRHRSAV